MVVEDLIELLRTMPATATVVGYFAEENGVDGLDDVIRWPITIDEAVYAHAEVVLCMSFGMSNEAQDDCQLRMRDSLRRRRVSLARTYVDRLVDKLFARSVNAQGAPFEGGRPRGLF